MTNSETNDNTEQRHDDFTRFRIGEAMKELTPESLEKIYYLISRPELLSKIADKTKCLPEKEVGGMVLKMVKDDIEASNLK